jgi:dTDP-4-dehydrorhamnose 3,5-epimerase
MDKLIHGVNLYPLKRIHNPKGDIFHALKNSDEGFFGFGEIYFTQIYHKQVKGWKRHNRFPLNLIVITGRVKFIIFDDREGSKSKGRFCEIELSPNDNYKRLTIEPGIWMSFFGMDESVSTLMDIIPEPHNPEESDRKELDEIPYNFYK